MSEEDTNIALPSGLLVYSQVYTELHKHTWEHMLMNICTHSRLF